jgi:hypothetical protein
MYKKVVSYKTLLGSNICNNSIGEHLKTCERALDYLAVFCLILPFSEAGQKNFNHRRCMFVRGKNEWVWRDAGLAVGLMECEHGPGADVVVGGYCLCVSLLYSGHYGAQDALLSFSQAPI